MASTSEGYTVEEYLAWLTGEVKYYQAKHYAKFALIKANRHMDFDRHYEALHYEPQKLEVNEGILMADADPMARLDGGPEIGEYYAYGPNGWRGDTPIFGSHDDDILSGDKGDDFIFGDDGDDTLYGRKGRDMLDGGRGDDFLKGGNGKDMLLGGLGNDRLYGSNGDDDIAGGFGDDWINGGDGDDLIRGVRGNNTIKGGPGNDTIRGGVGDDTIYGGKGDDDIVTSGGNDEVYGGPGNDRLGGPGIYYFKTGDGQDTLLDASLDGDGSSLGDEVWVSFEHDPNIDSFDDLRIEKKLDGSVHPRALEDGFYRVWYSDNDYIDILYPIDGPLPDAPTEDAFIF